MVLMRTRMQRHFVHFNRTRTSPIRALGPICRINQGQRNRAELMQPSHMTISAQSEYRRSRSRSFARGSQGAGSRSGFRCPIVNAPDDHLRPRATSAASCRSARREPGIGGIAQRSVPALAPSHVRLVQRAGWPPRAPQWPSARVHRQRGQGATFPKHYAPLSNDPSSEENRRYWMRGLSKSSCRRTQNPSARYAAIILLNNFSAHNAASRSSNCRRPRGSAGVFPRRSFAARERAHQYLSRRGVREGERGTTHRRSPETG